MDKPLKVLIACEYSGIVRNAFLEEGLDAFSCDLLPSEDGSNRHITGDVREVIHWGWDLMMVAHPPCTRLCNSGVRWLSKPPEGRTLSEMWHDLDEGAELFSELWNADIQHVAIENPIMHKYAKARIHNFKPANQYVQPWQFATHEASVDNQKKRTGLWLRNLPKLETLDILDGSTARDEVHKARPGPGRWKERSRFFPGIAKAMAAQWGSYALNLKQSQAA